MNCRPIAFHVFCGLIALAPMAALTTRGDDATQSRPPHIAATDWPRWRGAGGGAVAEGFALPTHWSESENIRWSATIPGEGSSSPVVCGARVFVTSAKEGGTLRIVHCLQRDTGRLLWSREIADDWPELTSALTGHAASTPATDGRRVVAFFGNAGAVCYDFEGQQLWRREFGDFESELGLASSPIIYRDTAILVCDHDGNRFGTFDSFLIALDLKDGATRWKTDRRGLYRSWSTPIVVPGREGRDEMVVNAQDELRGYDPVAGDLLWRVTGMTGWVTPSPVWGGGLIFATSGKDGPTMAVRPGGRGDVSESHVAWSEQRGAPYVCSPLLYKGYLYVHNEQGILTCRDAASGEVAYQKRLDGKFVASGVAGEGKIYLTNEAGKTFVVRAGPEFAIVAENTLHGDCWASPALSRGEIFLRTGNRLYCIGQTPSKP